MTSARVDGIRLPPFRALCAAATLSLLTAGCGMAAGPSMRPPQKHRGVNYAHAWRNSEQLGYGSPASAQSIERLRSVHVNWIALTPFGFQQTSRDTTIRWGGARFSESDARLRAATEQAHARGIQVMLKPHLWLRPPDWVGLIDHDNEAAWAAWFDAYQAFVLHYANVAAAAGMDAFCIGNELEKTIHRFDDWRRLIAAVRRVYPGPLVYGAGKGTVADVRFWDDLDFIGVSAYYELTDEPAADRAALVKAWRPIVAELAALSRRWRKPVLFTELGYPSSDYGASRPWQFSRGIPVNLQQQADAYAAFFEAVWPQPWMAGVYWWKWFSFPDDGGEADNDYTPANKPAERVMRHYFGESQ